MSGLTFTEIQLMANRLRISVISYLNSIPFVYGLTHDNNLEAELSFAPPAMTAQKFELGEADIVLTSAAIVPSLKDAEVITDYCIGAVGPVRTVVIMSNEPIEQVRRIWVDSHSRSSIQLAGYLAKNCWKINPEWIELSDYNFNVKDLKSGDAVLLIGDKVFEHEGEEKYCYDLAQEWIKETKLPFTFGLWVARKGISGEVISQLQNALTYGLEHIYEAILELGHGDKEYAYEYLTQNIDYLLDTDKRIAVEKLWKFGLKVCPKPAPAE